MSSVELAALRGGQFGPSSRSRNENAAGRQKSSICSFLSTNRPDAPFPLPPKVTAPDGSCRHDI